MHTFTFSDEYIPAGVTSLRVHLGGSLGQRPRTWDLEVAHRCDRCQETMRSAWGEVCPICLGPIRRQYRLAAGEGAIERPGVRILTSEYYDLDEASDNEDRYNAGTVET